MDVDDVEIAAGWPGERRGEFVKAMLSVRLLDECGGVFSVHDWTDHNEYASHSPERSMAQRLNGHKQFCKGKGSCDVSYCPARVEPMALGNEPTVQPAAPAGTAKLPFGSAPVPSPVNPLPLPLPTTPEKKSVGRRRRARTATHFEDEHPALQLAQHLLQSIRLHTPDFEEPNLQEWAKQFQKKLNNYPADNIREAITFAIANKPRHYQSAGAFVVGKWHDGVRKWDTLMGDMKSAKQRAKVISFPGGNGTDKGSHDVWDEQYPDGAQS